MVKDHDKKKSVYFVVYSVLLFLFIAANPAMAADWPMFGNDLGNTRSQPAETIISPASVSNNFSPDSHDGLVVKWNSTTANPAIPIQGALIKTPAADDAFIYFTTSPVNAGPSGFVYKLDKNTGQIANFRDIHDAIAQCLGPNVPPSFDIQTALALSGNELIVTTTTGLAPGAFFPSCDFSNPPDSVDPACYQAPAFPNGGGYVVVMDKNTFNCKSATLVTNHPFEGILGSTTVASLNKGGKITRIAVVGISGGEEGSANELPKYPCCSTIGKVVAVDIDTGAVKWSTAMIDADPSTPQYDAVKLNKKGKAVVNVTGYAGATVWSSAPLYDPDHKQFIVTTGNAYTIGLNATPPQDLEPAHMPVDAFVAIDANNGKKLHVYRAIPDDFWNVDCVPLLNQTSNNNCLFEPVGPDHDFGAGASLVKGVPTPEGPIDIAVAINKAATVYAVDTSTLNPIWDSPPVVGPSNLTGLAGSATDQQRIYVTNPSTADILNPSPPDCDPVNNPLACVVSREWTLLGAGSRVGQKIYGGNLSALDLQGNMLWQNSDPLNSLKNSQAIGQNLPTVFQILNTDPETQFIITQFILPSFDVFGTAPYLGPPTVANGVVFAESLYPDFLNLDFETTPFELILASAVPQPNMFAYDAGTGDLLWEFAAMSASPFPFPPPLDVIGNPVIAGPAVVDGVVYWGALDAGTLLNTSIIYAFEVPSQP